MKEAAQLIKRAYLRRKKASRGFTLRILAERLDVSVPFLSQMMSGKRAIPVGQVDPLCSVLDLDVEQRDMIFRAALRGKSPVPRLGISEALSPSLERKENVDWSLQPSKTFWLLGDPIYFTVMNATLLKAYDGSPEWIAARLKMPLPPVAAAVEKLLAEGFLEKLDGRLQKSTRFNIFSSELSKEEIRAYHAAGLKRAQQGLLEQTTTEAVERRLITSSVVTVPETKVIWAKQQIKAFLENMVAELGSEAGDNLYQFSLQFLPLTDKAEPKRRR